MGARLSLEETTELVPPVFFFFNYSFSISILRG